MTSVRPTKIISSSSLDSTKSVQCFTPSHSFIFPCFSTSFASALHVINPGLDSHFWFCHCFAYIFDVLRFSSRPRSSRLSSEKNADRRRSARSFRRFAACMFNLRRMRSCLPTSASIHCVACSSAASGYRTSWPRRSTESSGSSSASFSSERRMREEAEVPEVPDEPDAWLPKVFPATNVIKFSGNDGHCSSRGTKPTRSDATSWKPRTLNGTTAPSGARSAKQPHLCSSCVEHGSVMIRFIDPSVGWQIVHRLILGSSVLVPVSYWYIQNLWCWCGPSPTIGEFFTGAS
mmetsp:Transcript_2717/g.6331  ORF Transcript_2717/g.6331 Transcript_2717/m.6331 type:complete len:290 (+) Transcript_2717:2708-3577(+)